MLNYYPKDYAYASGLKEGDSGVLDEIVFYKDSNGKVNKYQFQKDSKYLNFTDATDLYQKEFAQNSKANSEDEYDVVKIMLDDFNNIDMGDDEEIEPTIENTETSNLDLNDNQSETEIHEPIANSETSNAIEERESNKSNVSSEESNYTVQEDLDENKINKESEILAEESNEIDKAARAEEIMNNLRLDIMNLDDTYSKSAKFWVSAYYPSNNDVNFKVEKVIVTNNQTGNSIEIKDHSAGDNSFDSDVNIEFADGENVIEYVFYDNYGNTRQETRVTNKLSN